MRFYYTGYSHSHGNHGGLKSLDEKEPNKPLTKSPILPSSLNLATLRRDGFASIDALYPLGCMTTRLIQFEGEKLIINADAENGYILVELTDEEGKAIPGYTKEECVPFNKDEIHGQVQWKSNKNLATVREKAVHIKFHMQSARLFSFRLC